MSGPRWYVDDVDPDNDTGATSPVATLHFLRAALRRRRRVWLATALVGLLLGVCAAALGGSSQATVTLSLAHQAGIDPDQAMATDISLLRTRSVAAQTLKRLGLDLAPEGFEGALTVDPETTSIVKVTVAAQDDKEALRQVRTLSQVYLAFRATQIEAQAKARVAGNDSRQKDLQRQVDQLTTQYNQMITGDDAQRDQASDVLTQRAQLTSQISTLQQDSQDTLLQSQSVVSASTVLDSASVVPRSPLRGWVLAMFSGLVGGLALGVGLVLLRALTSDRLHTRDEVALALGAPVRYSVSGLAPSESWWARSLPSLHATHGESTSLEVAANAVETALSAGFVRQARLAVAGVGGGVGPETVVASVAVRLCAAGRSVFLVDLSDRNQLEQAVSRALGEEVQHDGPATAPTVFRPDGVPSLAAGPMSGTSSASALPRTDPRRQAWDAADVILVLADIDPAIGVDELTTWSRRVVMLVTAGSASAERLRTTGELVRSAGLQLLFAVLLGADRHDESLGRADESVPEGGRARKASS